MSAQGKGPLISAAVNGNLELVKRLLGNQAQLTPPFSSCTLEAAAGSGNLALVQFLIEKGADVNNPPCPNQYRFAVLMKVAQSGKADVVREILKHHPDVNAKDWNGDAALSFALTRPPGNGEIKEIIDLLVAAGADVNSRNNNEEAAIFKACSAGPEAIRELAKAGADLNEKIEMVRRRSWHALETNQSRLSLKQELI